VKLANRFYNSANGRKEPVVIAGIAFFCDGIEYSIIDMTDTEVCVLVEQEYYKRGTLLLPCWWNKDRGQVVQK